MGKREYVGRLITTSGCNVLITAMGKLRLLPTSYEFGTFAGRPLLVVGEGAGDDAIVVAEVYPLLSERELIECTSFVLKMHGAKAKEHAESRVSAAVARNDLGDAETWRSICQRIDRHLARNPWQKSEI